MTNLVVLAVCFTLGILLRWSGRLPAEAHKVINAFIINVALPALVLRYIHDLRMDGTLLLPAVAPWLLFGCGAVFFTLVGRRAGWSRQTTGGLIMAGSLANTSFVGLPMIEAFYGPSYLGVGLLEDQLGTYLVLGTVGVLVANAHTEAGRPSLGRQLAKVAAFPPFQALVLALLLINVPYPSAIVAVLDRLGSTLVPLALVSVGYQLRLGDARACLGPLGTGLLFKLVLGPACIALVLLGVLGAHGPVTQVAIFETAMGPQIGGAIVAMEHGLNPRLVSLMVGIGIPLSLLSAALWWYLLQGV